MVRIKPEKLTAKYNGLEISFSIKEDYTVEIFICNSIFIAEMEAVKNLSKIFESIYDYTLGQQEIDDDIRDKEIDKNKL